MMVIVRIKHVINSTIKRSTFLISSSEWCFVQLYVDMELLGTTVNLWSYCALCDNHIGLTSPIYVTRSLVHKTTSIQLDRDGLIFSVDKFTCIYLYKNVRI